MMRSLSTILAAFGMIGSLACGAKIQVQMVTVGDPGNAPDTAIMNDGTTGYGSVDYIFNIGKFDITQAQYAAFLDAKGATDTYGLYSQSAGTDTQNGIVRSGSPGSYTYSVSPTYATLPAVDVSLYDAIRFVNWLTNGQGNRDTETGSYTLTNPTYYASLGYTEWTVTVPSAAQRAAWSTSSTVHYLVPSEDEFYKVAYYKGGGTNAGYWSYPTQTNSSPISEPPPGASNSMNVASPITGFALTHSTINDPSQVYSTEVGAYSLALGAYGTLDQGGDVRQWTDTYTVPKPPEITATGNDYVIRGSSWFDVESASSFRLQNDADLQDSLTGFRITSVGGVPEPSSGALLIVAVAMAILVWAASRFIHSPRAVLGKLTPFLTVDKTRSLANAIPRNVDTSLFGRTRGFLPNRSLHFEALELRALLNGAALPQPAMPYFDPMRYFNPATGQPYPAGTVPAGDTSPSGLLPAQIQNAYGFNQIPGISYNQNGGNAGLGQTIAILASGYDIRVSGEDVRGPADAIANGIRDRLLHAVAAGSKVPARPVFSPEKRGHLGSRPGPPTLELQHRFDHEQTLR